MSFQSELDALNQHKVNLVIRITTSGGDVFFSKHAVDSGLTVDADKIGLVSNFSVNATQIDLTKAKQSVGSAKVTILDKDNVFSDFLGVDNSSLISLKISLFVGLVARTGQPDFDFSDYIVEKENYIIKTLSKSGNIYSLGVRSQSDRMSVPTFGAIGTLPFAVSDVQSSITITTSEDTFQSSGQVKIEDEFIAYTTKVFSTPITTLTGISRGDLSSTAGAHPVGAEAVFVETITDNTIDILLQIILSTGNGTNGAFDVLSDGIGIPAADVKISKFTSIRDTFFASDDFTFSLYEIDNTLKFIEEELLQANNLRLTEEDGLISLAVLDQSVPGTDLPVVNEDVISAKPGPTWKISENRLINEFTIQFFFVEGTRSFAKSQVFRDLTSQSIFGLRRGSNFKFKGIQSDFIAKERGRRILNRFASPQSEVSVTQFLKTFSTPPGDKVTFTHPDVPKPGGGIGLDNELELLKRSIDYATGRVKASYIFTSYINVRRGLIAPRDDVITIIDTKNITVGSGRGALYRVGYVMNLYDNTTCVIIGGQQLNPIETIVGDTITFENAWTGLVAGTTMIRFSDYDDSAENQQERFAYTVGGSGLFADGSGGYQIF